MLIYLLYGLKLGVKVKVLMMSQPSSFLGYSILPFYVKWSSINPQDIILVFFIFKKSQTWRNSWIYCMVPFYGSTQVLYYFMSRAIFVGKCFTIGQLKLLWRHCGIACVMFWMESKEIYVPSVGFVRTTVYWSKIMANFISSYQSVYLDCT